MRPLSRPKKRASSFRPRPPKFIGLSLGGSGFRCVAATHPTNPVSSWVRVPWPVRLPPTSFRFGLATDTLALGYGRRSPAHVRDSHPIDDAHAGRTHRQTGVPVQELLLLFFLYYYTATDDRIPAARRSSLVTGYRVQLIQLALQIGDFFLGQVELRSSHTVGIDAAQCEFARNGQLAKIYKQKDIFPKIRTPNIKTK